MNTMAWQFDCKALKVNPHHPSLLRLFLSKVLSSASRFHSPQGGKGGGGGEDLEGLLVSLFSAFSLSGGSHGEAAALENGGSFLSGGWGGGEGVSCSPAERRPLRVSPGGCLRKGSRPAQIHITNTLMLTP